MPLNNTSKTINQKRYTLRINAKVFAEAEKRAKEAKRSIAKEIEYALEKFYFGN